jgi:hypothetical protein
MVLSWSLPALLVLGGCSDENPNEIPGTPTGNPGNAAQGRGPAAGNSNPKIKEIMVKVGGRGPQALQTSLSDVLKQTDPAWDTIQGKAHEYAQLTSALGKLDPVRGAKDSWQNLTETFAQSAADLDKAAQAKDKQQTQVALDTLGSSCMGCHRQHRMMGPGGRGGGPGRGGPGGMGLPPGGFPPPGGPPGGPPPTGGEPKAG